MNFISLEISDPLMIQPPHMEHFWKWAGILFSRPIFTFSSHSLLVSIIRFIWIIYYYEELTPFTYKLWIWFRFIWWQFGHGYPNSTERAENWFHSDQWSDFLLLLFFGHAKFYYAKSGYILPISDERAIYTIYMYRMLPLLFWWFLLLSSSFAVSRAHCRHYYRQPFRVLNIYLAKLLFMFY